MVRISFQDTLQDTVGPQQILGAKANTPDGSTWQYIHANSAISKGMIASPLASAGYDNVSSSANGAGQIVFVTKAAAGWTVGQFNDAWLVVDDGTGEGQVAKIKTNTSDTLELYIDWALSVALDVVDSDITISVVNTNAEKVPITVKTTVCLGAAQVDIAAGFYSWVLSKGPGVVLGNQVITENKNFTPGATVAGEVILGVTAEGPFNAFNLGYSLAANTTVDKGFLALMGIASV